MTECMKLLKQANKDFQLGYVHFFLFFVITHNQATHCLCDVKVEGR